MKGANMKHENGKTTIDIGWLRSMSDEDLTKWVTDLRNMSLSAQNMIIDLRDAMLGVLVKHGVCPYHWMIDGCPVEVYGKQNKIGAKYESDLMRSMKLNRVLRGRIKELENKSK